MEAKYFGFGNCTCNRGRQTYNIKGLSRETLETTTHFHFALRFVSLSIQKRLQVTQIASNIYYD